MPIWHGLAKHSILILEGIIKKCSYERRDYESLSTNAYLLLKIYSKQIVGKNFLLLLVTSGYRYIRMGFNNKTKQKRTIYGNSKNVFSNVETQFS